MEIRFTLNQLGLALEYFKLGEWRCALLLSPAQVEKHGGVSLTKSKLLYSITDRYELVPAGEYKDASNITVTCV